MSFLFCRYWFNGSAAIEVSFPLKKSLSCACAVIFLCLLVRLMLACNVSQLRDVGLFEVISCPPVTKLATKNKPCEKPLPAPCFLRCCCAQFLYFFNCFPFSVSDFTNWNVRLG